MGLPLVGKSTLGEELEKNSNIVFLDVDVARRELRLKNDANSARGTEEYERWAMLKAYKNNHQKAEKYLRLEKPIVLAATYSRPIYHRMLKQLSKNTGTKPVVFLLECSGKGIKERIKSRIKNPGLSNILDFESYLSVKNRYKTFKEIKLFKLNTQKEPSSLVEEVFKKLGRFVA